MARATRNPKPVAAASSPPRTRSKAKGKEAAAASSSSQPVTNTAQSTKKRSTRATQATDNNTSEDSSDNANTTTTRRSTRRQPAVNRNNTNRVTKSRAPRKAPSKAASNTKKTAEQHIDEAVATPAPPATPAPAAAPARRTRAALKAGAASPLAAAQENIDVVTRKAKNSLKDATPLSIMQSQDDPRDDDDWFKNMQQEPRIYRDPGASMEEISDHEGANDDIVNNDTATSDGEDTVGEDDVTGEDVEMAVEHTEHDTVEHIQDDASETEEDMADEDIQQPRTPIQTSQPTRLEAPTTGRTFGISSLFFNPLTSVRKLFGHTPAPTSPSFSVSSTSPLSAAQSPTSQSHASPATALPKIASPKIASPNNESMVIEPTNVASPKVASPKIASPDITSPNESAAIEYPNLTSPSSAAHERKALNANRVPRPRNRKTPITPRQKNADKRHVTSELQMSISKLSHEELLNLAYRQREEIMELKRKEAAQVPGEKRRRLSPDSIPAHRPGEKGYGMVDEFFGDNDYIIDARKGSAKRRKLVDDDSDDSDSEYDFAANDYLEYTPPSSLKRPRNSYRMAAMREGQQDPMVINHEARIMHQENSFSRSPLRESINTGNKKSPRTKKSSPSTVYSGSVMAMPGDSGYKPPNIFQMSEQQVEQSKKDAKMSNAELRRRAEEIAHWEKQGHDLTAEEAVLLEKAQRKFGHVNGTGSFSAPEYSSDEEDSFMSDDTEEDDSSPEHTASTASPSTKPAGENSTMQPPPAPTPAHAQLPTNKTTTTEAAAPKTPAPAQGTTSFQNAALARQRELAEKHKPKMGSRLQYVSDVASSPVGSQSPEGTRNIMSESLITQGFEANTFTVFDALLAAEEFESLLTEEEKLMVEKESEEEKNARENKAFSLFDALTVHGY